MNILEAPSLDDEHLEQAVNLAFVDGSKDAADALWRHVEAAEALAEANKALAEKATCRRNNALAEAERIKARVLFHLEARGLKSLPASFGKFTRCANGGHQPLRITVGVDELPAEFRRVKVEPDLDAVRRALKEGEVLPFVEIQERGTHLRLT